MRPPISVFVTLFTACAQPVNKPIAAPASQPSSQPASAPSGNASVLLPAGLFTPIDSAQPNGDQRITHENIVKLAKHLVHQRDAAGADLADCRAREQSMGEERDAANASAAQSSWQKTWVPILTGVGGATLSAAVVTLVEWGLGALKVQTKNQPSP